MQQLDILPDHSQRSVRSSNDCGGVIGDGDGSSDVLDDGGNGSEGVSFLDGVGEVAAQTIEADDGAVVARSANNGRSRDQTSLAGDQTSQQNDQLQGTLTTLISITSVHRMVLKAHTYDFHADCVRRWWDREEKCGDVDLLHLGRLI